MTEIFVDGISGLTNFDVITTPDNPIAVIFCSDSFYFIDLPDGRQSKTLKVNDHLKETEEGIYEWLNIRCLRFDREQTKIMALLFERKSVKYSIISLKENAEQKIMKVIDEHYLEPLKEAEDITVCLTSDYHGHLFFMESSQHRQAPKRTSFQVIKIQTDDRGRISTTLSSKDSITFDDHWYSPTLGDNFICFLPCIGDPDRIIKVSTLTRKINEYDIVPLLGDDYDKYPSGDSLSSPCLHKDLIIYYSFIPESGQGCIWTLNWKNGNWKRRFVLQEHVLKSADLIMSANDRLYMHGECNKAECGKAHIYHFNVEISKNQIRDKREFLTFSQLAPYFSDAKVQIIHGPKMSGKSFLLEVKALKAVAADTKATLQVVTSKRAPKDHVHSIKYGPNGVLENKLIPNDHFFLGGSTATDCDLYIDMDDLQFLTYNQKCWLIKRSGKSIIILNRDLCHGLDQPRQKGTFAWYRCRPRSSNAANLERDRKNSNRLSLPKPIKTPSNADIASLKKGFIGTSMGVMDQFYPKWWNSATEKKETICIPACLDLYDSRYRGPTYELTFGNTQYNKRRKQFLKQEAEDNFLLNFQKLRIGGVLVYGFDTARYSNEPQLMPVFKGWDISRFRISFIFIHPSLGIYLIHVKSTKQFQNSANSIEYAKSVTRLMMMRQQMLLIFELITGQPLLHKLLHCAVCFPFAELYISKSHGISDHIDQSSLNNIGLLRNIFLDRTDLMKTHSDKSEALQKFASTLVGYRSVEFQSGGANALAVHKLIDNQAFNAGESKNFSEANTLFLTAEQLRILDCEDDPQIIISGPPGTGKTLILLKKALKAANERKEGNVRIITENQKLCHKFRKYFESSNKKCVRLPIVGDRYEDTAPNDDVFLDELLFYGPTINFLKKRLKVKGKTIAAITGRENPLRILSTKEALQENKLNRYKYFDMKTVLRSSKVIFEEWRKDFPSQYKIQLGHNICGPAIQHITETNTSGVLEQLVKLIRECLDRSGGKILPQHIAVITETTLNCNRIVNFIASENIQCGSIEQQVNNGNLIAVARFTDTMSFEWPIVFIASLKCIDLYDPFVLIAASRCMVKLCIIKRDYMAIQLVLDGNIEDRKVRVERVYLKQFCDVVKDSRRQLGEVTDDCYFFDVTLAIIRYNYCPPELKATEIFGDCNTLVDCYVKIIENDDLCKYLQESKEIQSSLKKVKSGKWFAGENYPRLFRNVLSRNNGLEVYAQELFQSVVQRLSTVDDTPSSHATKEYDDNVSKLALMLRFNLGWKAIKEVFTFTSEACSFR